MYGVIDIGSNTVRLVVYRTRYGKLTMHFTKKETLGLASYVDKDGNMIDEGVLKTIPVLREFSMLAQRNRVKDLFVIATAAIRNVKNSKDVLSRLEEATGLPIDLLSGEDEAICDFHGVMLSETFTDGIVLDIGGGSTEVVVHQDGITRHSSAIPMGSLNAYIDHVACILPTKRETDAIKNAFKTHLEALGLDDVKSDRIYAVGGTSRAVLKLNKHFFPSDIETNIISKDNLKALSKAILSDDKDVHVDVIRLIPERIHTIMPGLSILRTAVKHFGADLVVIERFGVREGYLYQQLLKRDEVIVMGQGHAYRD
jgi:exopolyphosphatase / guanosine-5'-triphosphate,3'-diphosphate pyrophosphatase